MAVTDDVIAKCIEIEAELQIFCDLVSNAETAWWVAGDATYVDFKSIADVQSDIIAALVTDLQGLTA